MEYLIKGTEQDNSIEPLCGTFICGSQACNTFACIVLHCDRHGCACWGGYAIP